MPKIIPFNASGAHRTHTLDPGLSVEEINEALGFEPNVQDDPWKVEHSWGFKVDGHVCGIWDYKGARWSAYDPDNVLGKVFPGRIFR